MSNKVIKELIKELRRQGWSVELSKRSGHYKACSPEKGVGPVFIASTPSEYRSTKNVTSELRKRGADV